MWTTFKTMELEVNNPYSSLLNFSSTSNIKNLREKVDGFKSYVQKSKLSQHVIGDLFNFCTWMKDRADLELDIEEECIVPIVKFFLEDANQDVSKMAYSQLAIMINSGKISKQSLENHFCSYLAKVINDTFDDEFRLQAINTIFELIFHIDKEIIAKEIMPEITKLCLNPNTDFTLKTACATRFSNLASRLERDLTERTIIPLYEKMANDKFKIRKNCVEVSVALSYICSKEVRETILVPIYLRFLKDPSKYVSDLALIALGPFIASFANSEQSEHHHHFNEVLVNNIYNFNYGKINIDFNLPNPMSQEERGYNDFKDMDDTDDLYDIFLKNELTDKLKNNDKSQKFQTISNLNFSFEQDDENVELKVEFNSFNYWRVPLMNIDDMLDANETSSSSNSLEQDKDENGMARDEREKASMFFTEYIPNREKRTYLMYQTSKEEKRLRMFKIQKEDMLVTNIEKCLKLLKDSIVPKDLLFYFLKNLLSNYGSNVYQADINCICAFSLPAVAFTLGKENWPCLRSAFNQLVVGLSTNIRLILASSLHELAKIIGPFYANRDILPALFAFMRSTDQVKERILKNLSRLVNIFDKSEQRMILRRLPQFYKLENPYNWRFRVEFIDQFMCLVILYDKPRQFNQIIIPMIFSLLEDQVAEVRKSCIPLLILTIEHIYDLTKNIVSLNGNKIKESILDQIYYKLYLNKKWTFRQLFILVCENIVLDCAVPLKTFKEKLLTPLLTLSKDKVVNVRLTLSKVLSNAVFRKNFGESTQPKFDEVIELLSKDKDADVRSYFVVPKEEDKNWYNRLYDFSESISIRKSLADNEYNSLNNIEALTTNLDTINGINGSLTSNLSNSLNNIEALTNQIGKFENYFTNDATLDINQDSNQNSNQDLNQNSNQDSNQNSNQDSNQDLNQDLNQDSNQDSNQGMNQNSNHNADQGTKKDLNKNPNQDTKSIINEILKTDKIGLNNVLNELLLDNMDNPSDNNFNQNSQSKKFSDENLEELLPETN